MAIGKLARCVTRAEKESNGGFDNEEEDEVEHIRRVLVKCAPWFYSLFDWCESLFELVAQRAGAASVWTAGSALHMSQTSRGAPRGVGVHLGLCVKLGSLCAQVRSR